MTDWSFQVVMLVMAVNPAGAALASAADRGRRIPQGAWAALVAAGVLVAAVLLADPLLEWLDVAPESFRTAAGIVMGAQGARMVWSPATSYGRPARAVDGIIPLGWPVVANAAAVMTATSFAADGADVRTAVSACAAAITAGAAIVLAGGRDRAMDGLARLVGGVLVAGAAALIVSGVRDV